MNVTFMKQVTWYLVVAMFIIGIAPRVDAGFAPSEIIALSTADRNTDINKIRNFIEVKAVGDRLKQLGFTQEEIKNRLNQLGDQQIHQTALQLDDLKTGQGDALGLGIAVLMIAILVVILFNLIWHKATITR
jgi:hypothetical protein